MSLKYPEGARYIVKYLPTPDFDPASPSARPEYAGASVYRIWNIASGHASQPASRAGCMPARSSAACSSAMPGQQFPPDLFSAFWLNAMPTVQMTQPLYRFFPQLENRTITVPAGSVVYGATTRRA
jgi:hypothetical protein